MKYYVLHIRGWVILDANNPIDMEYLIRLSAKMFDYNLPEYYFSRMFPKLQKYK